MDRTELTLDTDSATAARAALGGGALRDQAGDRRPGRDARAGAGGAARRRARAARGRAGPRQDAHREDAGRRGQRVVQAGAVHSGPGAGRPRRHAHLPAGHGRVLRRARAGAVQLPAGRRDQPRAREGAVGAARGHAGAPGHDRRRDLPRAGAVSRARHPEPDRVGGHVPAARGADGPIPDEDPRGLPVARPRRRRSSSACSRRPRR